MREPWPAIWRFRSIYANISAPRIADKQAEFVVETELFFSYTFIYISKVRDVLHVGRLKKYKMNEFRVTL